MTTTQQLSKYPDYYNSDNDAKQKQKHRTNPRYRGFDQTHFTAGDEEQFKQYMWVERTSIPKVTVPSICDTSSVFWEGYRNADRNVIMNTFHYIFHKFKKGIFVKIQDGKLRVFLPFSKANYTNEWSSVVNTNGFNRLAQDICEREGYRFNPKRVNGNTNGWYANGGIFRYEYPISEGDSNVGNVKNMLEELCEHENVPDSEFFINRRDFPILKRDGTEPYEQIWGEAKPLISHAHDKYLPILSMVTSDKFADVAIPNHNDWARVQVPEGKWFPKGVSRYEEVDTPWDKKCEKMVFRGASTGSGVTIKTNQRLKAVHLSQSCDVLDLGITSWNLRPRIIDGKIQTIDTHSLGFGLSPFMTSLEQSRYKYILHIEGHVAAFRLSNELAMGSVILIVQSRWKVWYSDKLVPFVHYIPVNEDLSDLLERVAWCKENDEKCRQIVGNARAFYDQYLSKSGILSELKSTICGLVHHVNMPLQEPGEHPLTRIIDIENAFINTQGRIVTIGIEKMINPPVDRTWGTLKGIEKVFDEKLVRDLKPLFTNKTSIIETGSLGGVFDIIRKSTTDEMKGREHRHEQFIGITSTNRLLQFIPNFAYVFGGNSTTLYTERIMGPTLHEWLISDKYTDAGFRLIITQLALALQMAQHECGFVHWDLTPWNVVLWSIPSVSEIDYKVSATKVISIRSNLIPVMIDYGKSKAIVNKTHHGFIHPFKTSTSQDLSTLILTSAKTLFGIGKRSVDIFLRFLHAPLHSRDIRGFLEQHGKYAEMTSSHRVLNTKFVPLDLVTYLKVDVIHKLSWKPFMNRGISRSMFESKHETIIYLRELKGTCTSMYTRMVIDDALEYLGETTVRDIYSVSFEPPTPDSFDENNQRVRELLMLHPHHQTTSISFDYNKLQILHSNANYHTRMI
jgi:hypothetical protein